MRVEIINVIVAIKTLSKLGFHISRITIKYIATEYRIDFLRRAIWNSMYSRILGIGIPRIERLSIFLDSSQSRLKNDCVKCSSIYTEAINGIAKIKEYVSPSGKYL